MELLVANAILMPDSARGQFSFQAYGGAGGGYYLQTKCMACDWTIAITPL